MHLRHDVVAVEDDRLVARRTKRDVEHRALFGGVDSLAAEHRVDALAQSARVGQIHEKADGLVGDAILRVVEVQAGGFGREALAARRVVGEQRAQMHVAHLLEVRRERPPGGQRGQ